MNFPFLDPTNNLTEKSGVGICYNLFRRSLLSLVNRTGYLLHVRNAVSFPVRFDHVKCVMLGTLGSSDGHRRNKLSLPDLEQCSGFGFQLFLYHKMFIRKFLEGGNNE